MHPDSPQPVDPPAFADDERAAITRILNDADSTRDGLDRVFGVVYAELKRIARRILGGAGAATLSPTALVHEAYAKLIGSETLDVTGRRHFYALCARTMRQLVVDHARARCAEKRGGGQFAVALTEDGVIDLAQPESLVSLDHALDRIERRDPRLAELMQYRVFAGLELPDIAPLMGVTVRQLQRDWQRARIWIADAMLNADA